MWTRPLLLCLLLISCRERGPTDLSSKVLFTANGSFDAQADSRKREGKGMRSVTWQKTPPLPARAIKVRYDSDARPLAWLMTVQQPSFHVQDLQGETRKVNTFSGPGFLFTMGRLKGVLLVQSDPQEFTLLTHGYAEQHEARYLPAFATR